MATTSPDLVEQATAEEVLVYAVERFHPRLTMACSFQKEESVLVHMLMEAQPDVRVFTIDTGVLFPETLQTWKRFEERFGLKVEVFDASSPGEPWTAEHCCSVAKVQALGQALSDVDAWITGIRREQATTRTGAAKLERDEEARDLEGQPAGRLEREGRLALHLQARSAVPSAPRSGLRLDRMRSLHIAWGRTRRPLGRPGQDRVRDPHVAVPPPRGMKVFPEV